MKFQSKKVMVRYFLVIVFLSLLSFLFISVRIYRLLVVEKDYWMAVEDKFHKNNLKVQPKRGQILADDGEVLAASVPEYKLFFDFMSGEKTFEKREKDQQRRDSLLYMNLDSISEGMHRIFPDINPRSFRRHMRKGRKLKRRYWPLYGYRRISYIQFCRVLELPLFKKGRLSGLTWETIETRKNPYGHLAARTIGDLFKGKDSARCGLELSFDSILRGEPGICHRRKVRNRWLNIEDKKPVNGLDLQTTINVKMQDICEKALGDQLRAVQAKGTGDVKFGVCILMEVATGDIKAITSLTQLRDGSFYEIQNKAVSTLLEPGSVFKPMSFLVAFNDGYIHLDDEVDTEHGVVNMYGRRMRDFNWTSGGFGKISIRQCIQKSSNVGVSTTIDRFYKDNPTRFIDGIYATGVADSLHLPLVGAATPRIKDPRRIDSLNRITAMRERIEQEKIDAAIARGEKSVGEKVHYRRHYWADTDLPWMSIGYVTQIPPISTLSFYNGLANGGRMMRPRFVKAFLRNNEIVKTFPPIVQRKKMASKEAVEAVKTCLREVVTLGVGKKANSKYVKVAGKTGTAQVWTAKGRTRKYFVSFAGFFPYDHPRYSMIVCVEKEGPAGGNSVCAPVFRHVAERVMALEPTDKYSAAVDTSKSFYPIVSNGNMSTAAHLLSNLNIDKVKCAFNTAEEMVWGVGKTESDGIQLTHRVDEKKRMPSVLGYGLRDALFRLELLGLKVKVKGCGNVIEQSIPADSLFLKGQEVEIYLSPDKKRMKSKT